MALPAKFKPGRLYHILPQEFPTDRLSAGCQFITYGHFSVLIPIMKCVPIQI